MRIFFKGIELQKKLFMFTIDNQMYLDMDFYVDQQTLDDLNIFGKYKDDDSVFHLFSKTRSYLWKEKNGTIIFASFNKFE